MKKTIVLHNAQQGHQALTAVLWPEVKAHLLCGGGKLVVSVKPETRSDPENRLLHSLLGQVAAQKEWAGSKRTVEVWKRLMVASWCRATGESVEVLPALDGHGVDLVPARTSRLTRGECADLITFVQAWAADQGVVFAALEDQ